MNMMFCSQAPATRGREQHSRKSLSISAAADVTPSSQMKQWSVSVTNPLPDLRPVTATSCQAENTPALTTKPVSKNKSTTLFSAVASRCANVSYSPTLLSNPRLGAAVSTATSDTCSSNSCVTSVASSQVKYTSCSGTFSRTSPELDRQTDVGADSTAPLSPGNTTCRSLSNIFKLQDTNPRTDASDMTAPTLSANIFNTTSKADDADPFGHTTSCVPSAEGSRRSATKKTKPTRPKPGKVAIRVQ